LFETESKQIWLEVEVGYGWLFLQACLVLIRLITKPLILAYLVIAPFAHSSSLFEDNAALNIQLKGPIQTIISKKKQEREERFALTIDGVAHSVSVSTRGNSRKKLCKFPPLRLKFEETGAKPSVFTSHEMLRLVTHCNKSRAAEENTIKEFIAYRILNLLTQASYRVRLLHITYIDTSRPDNEKKLVRYGFVVEPEQNLARRVGGELARQQSVRRSALSPDHSALVYVFQYLIGNTDWSLVKPDAEEICCHNGQLILRDSQLYYIPYDFDLAGLVAAKYAKPDRSLRIRRVTQRLYRGLCAPKAVLETAVRQLKSQRAEIIDLLVQVPGLSAREVEKQTRFLEKFFSEADAEDMLVDEFAADCH
jgi:hypothetical protein